MTILNTAKKILESRFFTKNPFILNHFITRKCNAYCDICPYKFVDRTGRELDTEEVYTLLDNAEDVGIVSYTVWGGEPLLRDDLGEVLKHAKEKDMITSVMTNGYNLPERVDEIGPYTDKLFVSIDHPSEKHDESRRLPGTYKNAIEGIEIIKNSYDTDVAINSVITELNKTPEDIRGLVELSNELGAKHSFNLLDTFDFNRHLKVSKEDANKALFEISRLKSEKKNVINSKRFLSGSYDREDYTCHWPKMFVSVNEVGEVEGCKLNDEKFFGSIREKSLGEIIASDGYQNYVKDAEKCHQCDISTTIEASNAYDLKPDTLLDMARLII